MPISAYCSQPHRLCNVIPFLNKNIALRSETHRTISFSAFCAFRGKSRGRDAPPTMTLQILMSDLLSELVLVWIRLNEVAYETKRTLYQVKHGLLDEYLRKQLESPTICMELA